MFHNDKNSLLAILPWKKRVLGLMTITAMAMLIAGCGGDDSGGGSATPPPTTGTISGYVTVPGTTAASPPTGTAAVPVTARADHHNSVQVMRLGAVVFALGGGK